MNDDKMPLSPWWGGGMLLFFYLVLTAGPLILALLLSTPEVEENFLFRSGTALALVGFPVLVGQVILAARLKIVDRVFGMNNVYVFHKTMAMVVGFILILHPFLLAASRGHWGLLTRFDQPWYLLLGKINLVLLLTTITISTLYKQLHMKYEQWRSLHNLIAVLLITLGFLHSLYIGDDLEHLTMRLVWGGLLAIAAAGYLYHKVIGPWLRRRHPFHIAALDREGSKVWTIKLTPPPGERPLEYLPGQFQFLTFYHSPVTRSEEHPFTISSSPTNREFHTSTIKESGDFTSTIGQLKVGDPVGVQAPFGRFTYLEHPEEDDLVFIAGGIGITPLMSMLRYMRDTGTNKHVLLLYANRREEDIVFRSELQAMADTNKPQLRIVHVLSQAAENWAGERGHVNLDLIRKYSESSLEDKIFYICGPPPMMDQIILALIRGGVRSSQVRSERFDL
jgi:predicted ferric reductase